MKRILLTGSREWTDPAPIKAALAKAIRQFWQDQMVLVHGGARGADTVADRIWRGWLNVGGLIEPEVHEVTDEDWGRHGRAAGPRRNAAMVALGADLCLAFPLGPSPGTRGCIDLARAAGIPVIVHEETTRV